MDEINYIVIEAEDGGESYTAYGINENDKFYLTDADTLDEIVAKCVPYARTHDVEKIEIMVEGLAE